LPQQNINQQKKVSEAEVNRKALLPMFSLFYGILKTIDNEKHMKRYLQFEN